MPTLYINAPQAMADGEGKRSFVDTLRESVGDGYAIALGDAERCAPGCNIVLLCQDGKRRAEGRLQRLIPTGDKTGSGMLRYNVHMDGLVEVSYSPPPSRLRHTGVLFVP